MTKRDESADGMGAPKNSGYPSQTYDDWVVTGSVQKSRKPYVPVARASPFCGLRGVFCATLVTGTAIQLCTEIHD